jgi:hypothetical protein
VFSAERSAVSSARLAGDAQQMRAGCDLIAILHQSLDGDLRVEVAEEGNRNRQARHGDRIAAVHHAGEARIRGDDALARHIMAAAGEAFAEILGKGLRDEGVEVEGGEGELGHGKRV